MSHVTRGCVSTLVHISPVTNLQCLLWNNQEILDVVPYNRVTTHIWMRHSTHMNVTWHTRKWVTSHDYSVYAGTIKKPGFSGHMNELRHTYEWVMSPIWMSHVTNKISHVTRLQCLLWDHQQTLDVLDLWLSYVTHTNESRHTREWVMSHIWMSRFTHLQCLLWNHQEILDVLARYTDTVGVCLAGGWVHTCVAVFKCFSHLHIL